MLFKFQRHSGFIADCSQKSTIRKLPLNIGEITPYLLFKITITHQLTFKGYSNNMIQLLAIKINDKSILHTIYIKIRLGVIVLGAF